MTHKIKEYLNLYSSGEIALYECAREIQSLLGVGYTSEGLKAEAEGLPPEVFSFITAEVDKAPTSMEDWARFRLTQGGDWDPSVSFSQIELALAESQVRYYRFVTAWRGAFSDENHQH